MKLKRFTCFAAALLVALTGLTVAAASPAGATYYSYELNEDGESVSAPQGFTVKEIMTSEALGLKTALNAPEDMLFKDGQLYILDSGNSRIVQLDGELKVKKLYDKFTDKDGNKIDFTGAKGFDIDKNGNFVIADFENTRVLLLAKDGTLVREILRPDSVLQNNDFPFQVSKVKCDTDGSIYVTVDSMNLGIFVFDEYGRFDKFVANNPVVKTADVILNYIYRRFMSTEQIRNRTQSTPLKVTNFCLDDEGFLYTVSQNSNGTTQDGMVRRINHTDTNIISSEVIFGDLETDSDSNGKTLFNSIAVTDEGNIILLDQGRGKVFYYSETGYLISVFGGLGDRLGTFKDPVEVRERDGIIYVLDKGKNSVTVFSPTEYMNTFTTALTLLKERKFDESLEQWKKVNLLNSNSEYAYYGMGLVYDLKADYAEAMKCFRLADNPTAYSNSFKEYRMQWLSQNAFAVVAVIVLIAAAVFAIKIAAKRLFSTGGKVYTPLETKWLFPIYTLRHPIDGFEQFKRRNIASVALSAAVIAVWFLEELLKKYFTGFIFAGGNTDFNPMALVVGTIGIYAVYVASSWCVASFIEGKGTLKDIVAATAYSMIPYVLCRLLTIPLSNVLTSNEAVFITLIEAIGLLWSAVLMLGGIYAIHQYSFSKTLLSVLLTVIGMIIIVFVLVIFYSLLQQAWGFIESLYQEITL